MRTFQNARNNRKMHTENTSRASMRLHVTVEVEFSNFEHARGVFGRLAEANKKKTTLPSLTSNETISACEKQLSEQHIVRKCLFLHTRCKYGPGMTFNVCTMITVFVRHRARLEVKSVGPFGCSHFCNYFYYLNTIGRDACVTVRCSYMTITAPFRMDNIVAYDIVFAGHGHFVNALLHSLCDTRN